MKYGHRITILLTILLLTLIVAFLVFGKTSLDKMQIRVSSQEEGCAVSYCGDVRSKGKVGAADKEENISQFDSNKQILSYLGGQRVQTSENVVGANIDHNVVFYFCIFAVLLIASGALAVIIVANNGSIADSEFVLQFSSISMIVVFVAMFGLLGVFEGRDMITIFGAIVGYVLGHGISRSARAAPSSISQAAMS